MFNLILSDGNVLAMTNAAETAVIKHKGLDMKAIKLTLDDTSLSLAQVKSLFSSELATANIKITMENGVACSEFNNYSVLKQIAIDPETEKYIVTLGETTNIPALITDLQQTISTLRDVVEVNKSNTAHSISVAESEIKTEVNAKIEKMISNIDSQFSSVNSNAAEVANRIQALNETQVKIESIVDSIVNPVTPSILEMSLEEAKAYQIGQSKLNLAAYLEANPVPCNCHTEGAVYTCTMEKQALLNNAIAMATLHQQAGDTEYTPSWNAHNEACTYDWTLVQLTELAFAIESFVKPLISRQQAMEKEILAAVSVEEIGMISIEF